MSIEFILSGGTLRVEKTRFIAELLQPRSPVRELLNYRLGETTVPIIRVDRDKEQNWVYLQFNGENGPVLGEDYRELIFRLKEALKDKITGKVQLMANYRETLFITLNLNEDNGKVKEEYPTSFSNRPG